MNNLPDGWFVIGENTDHFRNSVLKYIGETCSMYYSGSDISSYGMSNGEPFCVSTHSILKGTKLIKLTIDQFLLLSKPIDSKTKSHALDALHYLYGMNIHYVKGMDFGAPDSDKSAISNYMAFPNRVIIEELQQYKWNDKEPFKRKVNSKDLQPKKHTDEDVIKMAKGFLPYWNFKSCKPLGVALIEYFEKELKK
jgi:hypothetical protein